MTIYVDLPSDPLIEFNAFCRAIAKAVCPADENRPEGIDCIVGKLVTHQTPLPESTVSASGPLATSWQSVLVSQDGKTFDQRSRPDQAEGTCPELPFHTLSASPVVEVSFPYSLTDADRAALDALLPSLPLLRYPISPEQQEAFEQAYRQLAQRPAWLPILISANTMEQRKADQEHALGLHQKALLKEVSDGRITLLDAHHARVEGPGAVAFLSRPQAMAYLEQRGLARPNAVHSAMDGSGHKSEIEADHPSSTQTPRGSKIGKPKASEKRKAEAVAYCNKLIRKGEPDYAAQTAAKYGISERRLLTWRKDAEKPTVTPETVIERYARKGG